MTASRAGLASAQLLERVRAGEGWALELLFRRYAAPLRRWAHGRLPSWARGAVDTDDIVQDSLLGSLRAVQGIEAARSGAFHCYLRQAVRNRLRDELRRAARSPARDTLPSDAMAEDAGGLAEVIGREALAAYEQALASLAAEEREAVVARLELGLGYAEIADALGKPSPDAARMAVKRAVARLAEAMAAAGSPLR
jgi:RNA polymerase sigma-70 factor (ECF subfamily)